MNYWCVTSHRPRHRMLKTVLTDVLLHLSTAIAAYALLVRYIPPLMTSWLQYSPKKLRLPSSTRPPAASRCRHVPSARLRYDVPAKERASVFHLGEGVAWKSPSRGRLACPPRFFFVAARIFVFRTPTILNFRIAFWPLEPWTRGDKRACVNSTYCCTCCTCCTAVCSKGLVGGWVCGTLRRPWWVRGPFCTWESFCVLWEMNLFLFFFFYNYIPASHWVLGSATVPTAALLCPSLPYVLLHCRTAAVLLFCFFSTFMQRIIPLLLYVLLHCTAVLLPCYYFVCLVHTYRG